MVQAFSLKEIALQAGVSLATVDRVLHQREHVRTATRVRVEQALVELERQRQQVGRQGRRLLIDVVMETPERFRVWRCRPWPACSSGCSRWRCARAITWPRLGRWRP